MSFGLAPLRDRAPLTFGWAAFLSFQGPLSLPSQRAPTSMRLTVPPRTVATRLGRAG